MRYTGSVYQYRAGQPKSSSAISAPDPICFSPDGFAHRLFRRHAKQDHHAAAHRSGERRTGRFLVGLRRHQQRSRPGRRGDRCRRARSARWGGSRVIRYTPDGRIDREIMVPASQAACPGFGGKDLKTPTSPRRARTSTRQRSPRELAAGGLFAIEVDVAGQQGAADQTLGASEAVGAASVMMAGMEQAIRQAAEAPDDGACGERQVEALVEDPVEAGRAFNAPEHQRQQTASHSDLPASRSRRSSLPLAAPLRRCLCSDRVQHDRLEEGHHLQAGSH